MEKEELDNLLKRINRILFTSVMPDVEKVKCIKNIMREYSDK